MPVYVAHQDALEAMRGVFNCTPTDRVESWGWVVEAKVWNFRVQISSMAGSPRVVLEQCHPQRKGGSVYVTERTWEKIKHPDKLWAIMREIKEFLLGVGLALFQFCKSDPPV